MTDADAHPCDPTEDGCGHGIAYHPARVLMAQRRAVFDSRCNFPECPCAGYVTPMPPDPNPKPVRWKVAA